MPLPDDAETDDDSLLVTGTPCPPDMSGDIADIEGHIEELTIENSTQENDDIVAENSENLEEEPSDIPRPDILYHDNCDNDNVELQESTNLTSCDGQNLTEEQEDVGIQNNNTTEEETVDLAASSEPVQETGENPDSGQCSNIDSK